MAGKEASLDGDGNIAQTCCIDGVTCSAQGHSDWCVRLLAMQSLAMGAMISVASSEAERLAA